MDENFNIKPDTQNLLEEKVGNSLELLGTGKEFLAKTPLVQALRSTSNKWDFMKWKKALNGQRQCHSDNMAAYIIRFLPTAHPIEGLYLKYIKNSKTVNQEINNPINKWGIDLNRGLSMTEKYRNVCLQQDEWLRHWT